MTNQGADGDRWRQLPAGDPRELRAASPRPEIVYLDPRSERSVSPYSPEGEIRMMGEFAAGLARGNRGLSRPMAFALVVIVLLPIALSVLALLTSW